MYPALTQCKLGFAPPPSATLPGISSTDNGWMDLIKQHVQFPCISPCSTLSQCCHAVVALLYPFVWQHTYIPVLPPAMLDIVCTPTPFIVGLLSSSLPQLTELPLEEVREALIPRNNEANLVSFIKTFAYL